MFRDQDVPSPIDLRDSSDAGEWVAAADRTRPWRVEIRKAIAELLRALRPAPRRVLELGAGPGLLAEAILQVCSLDNYTLFDFSPPMLDMSRARLAAHPSAAFICGDFKLPDWTEHFSLPFDVVVAMQAVHEIRHKRHVPRLYRHVRDLLRPGGLLVICDHVPPDDSARLTALHSTEAEQHAAFAAAGFADARTLLVLNGLYVCTAMRPYHASTPMPFAIRRAVPDDAPQLSQLAQRAKAHWNYPAEWLAVWQPQLTIEPRYLAAHRVLVAENAGRLVGMCAIEDQGTWWSLEHVWVDPTGMGQGVGRALLLQALNLARTVRSGRVVAEADPHAAGFYRRMGASEVGVVPAAMPGAPDRVLPVFVFMAD